jgi:hypothetical protein
VEQPGPLSVMPRARPFVDPAPSTDNPYHDQIMGRLIEKIGLPWTYRVLGKRNIVPHHNKSVDLCECFVGLSTLVFCLVSVGLFSK